MKPLAQSAAGGAFACVKAVKTSRILKTIFVGLSCLLIGIGSASGFTRYSVATGNWTNTTTWSATSGGTSGASAPVAGDIVYIENNKTVTINANAACTDVNIATGSTLTINGFNFTSSGTVTVSGTLTNTSATATKTFTNVSISGGTWTSNVAETYAITNLTLAGSTINGAGTGIFNVTGTLNVNSGTNTLNALTITVGGTTTVQGSLIFASTIGNKTFAGVVMSGGTWTSNAAETYPMTSLTLSGGTITGSAAGTFTVSGNASVTNGTVNNLNGLNLTVAGTTIVDGTMNILSATGSKTFTGLMTINSTGTVANTTVNESMIFQGGITNNGGAFNIGTGVQTFNTNAQALTGVLSIPSMTVTGVTVTNNGNLTVATALTGTGGVTNAATGTLNIGGTSGINTLTATAVGNTVNYNGGVQTVKATTYSNLTLSNSGTETLGGNTTVNQVLSMEGTATLAAGGSILTYGAASTIQYKGTNTRTTGAEFPNGFAGTGGLIVDQGSGNIVTLNASKTALTNINIKSGALDLATFTANRPTAGGALTVAGTLILGSNTGGQTGSNFPTNFSTVTLAGGTVNYDNAGAQTVYGINYYNLTLSGSGAKTLQTSTTSITGDLTLAGTATTTAVVGLAVGADVVLGTGTTFDAATFTYTVGGNWTNNGGVFTQGTSTINFIGNNSLINGTAATQTFNNLVVTKLTGQTLTVNGSTTTLAVNGFYTLTSGDFYAPATMTVAGDITLTSGNFVAGTSLTASGNWENNGALLYPQNGTVIFNGANKVIKGNTSNTFDNLTINNANGIFLGCSQTVNKVLTLTSGRLTLGISNLTLGAVATVTGTFSPTSMIVTDDIGEMRKVFTSAATSFTFPVGEATGTIEYTPITLNFTSGTYGSGAYASARVVNAIHPANSGTTNYLNRYWDVNQSGITAFSCNVTGTYTAADVTGSITNLKSSRYTGVLPWTFYTALSANTLTASAVTTFGDFSGVDSSVGTPVIAISVTQLYGFSYNLGSGPSAQQSFAVSGQFLTNDVLVTPPTDYEISTTSGPVFQSTAITLTRVGGVVNATIYVRLKAGLSVAAYNSENIAITSSPATTKNIPCYGFVRPSVTANASPSAVCEGSAIALTSTGSTFTNKYWTGPNSFYAPKDSTIPSATFAMSGTYTVNANVLTGNNIVANGNFSAGVTGFSSSYTNNQTDLVPEGAYAVITNPRNVHTNFFNM